MARRRLRLSWLIVPLFGVFAIVNGVVTSAASQVAVGVILIVLSFFGPWIRRRLIHPGTDFSDPSFPDDGDAGGGSL
jgi:hypothetical protein